MWMSFVLCFFVPSGSSSRLPRSAVQSLSDETSSVFQEVIAAINPIYVVVVGCLIAAGCAFELAYGSRGSSMRTTHIASRNNNTPFTVRSG